MTNRRQQQMCELKINDMRLVLPANKGTQVVELLREAIEVAHAGLAIGHPELSLRVLSEREGA